MGGRLQGLERGVSTVAIGQFGAGENKTANLREIERLAQTAAENGAEMLFLPEYSMYYAKVNARSKNIEAAEPCDGAFIIALGELCRRYGLWIAAGMYERTDGLPYNTIAVLDDRGSLRGTHRKNRLYDAFGYRESDECRAGDKPFSPIETEIGHAVGGVCPFGVNDGVTVYLDESLRRFETVFPACGSSNSAIEVTIPELEKFSGFKAWVDICKGWREA